MGEPRLALQKLPGRSERPKPVRTPRACAATCKPGPDLGNTSLNLPFSNLRRIVSPLVTKHLETGESKANEQSQKTVTVLLKFLGDAVEIIIPKKEKEWRSWKARSRGFYLYCKFPPHWHWPKAAMEGLKWTYYKKENKERPDIDPNDVLASMSVMRGTLRNAMFENGLLSLELDLDGSNQAAIELSELNVSLHFGDSSVMERLEKTDGSVHTVFDLCESHGSIESDFGISGSAEDFNSSDDGRLAVISDVESHAQPELIHSVIFETNVSEHATFSHALEIQEQAWHTEQGLHNHLSHFAEAFFTTIAILGIHPYAISMFEHNAETNHNTHHGHFEGETHVHLHIHGHHDHHNLHDHLSHFAEIFFKSYLRIAGIDPYAICVSEHHTHNHEHSIHFHIHLHVHGTHTHHNHGWHHSTHHWHSWGIHHGHHDHHSQHSMHAEEHNHSHVMFSRTEHGWDTLFFDAAWGHVIGLSPLAVARDKHHAEAAVAQKLKLTETGFAASIFQQMLRFEAISPTYSASISLPKVVSSAAGLPQ